MLLNLASTYLIIIKHPALTWWSLRSNCGQQGNQLVGCFDTTYRYSHSLFRYGLALGQTRWPPASLSLPLDYVR